MPSASKPWLVAVVVLLSVASASAGSARLKYTSVSDPGCRIECAEAGYNAAWDAWGHVVLSPQSKVASDQCSTFFGYIQDGATAPPQGSGELIVYDYAQNEYNATYSAASFTFTAQECIYYFTPEMDDESKDGMYRLTQVPGETSGPACPKDESCYGAYWVTINAMGVFAFVDTSDDSNCPAFFALANPGSDDEGGTFTIAGVAAGNWTSWVPPGYSGSYDGKTGKVSISTPTCTFQYQADGATVDFPDESPPATAGAAIVDFYGVSPMSEECSSTCDEAGYNVVWDATGQIFMSPRSEGAGCNLYFGLASEGAVPPPYGSGTVVLYDYMQNMYVATYTPTSFTVAAGPCTYYFSGPQLNSASGGGVAKIALEGSLSGSGCPSGDDAASCYQSYWVTGNGATGVFGFVDAGRGPCPALFAVADQSSTPMRGTLIVIGAARSQEATWVPEGYNVTYDAEGMSIKMQTPGCHGAYKIDSYGGGGSGSGGGSGDSGGLTFPDGGPPVSPGTATLAYNQSNCSAVPPCMRDGYNAVWDAQGLVVLSPSTSDEDCPVLLGTAAAGSGPPPYGSGVINLGDIMIKAYTATYSPSSFVVKADSSNCSYTFDGPKLNSESRSSASLRKIVLAKDSQGGADCPHSPCSESFWVTNTTTVLALVDAADSACPTYIFRIDPNSDYDRGTFSLAGSASGTDFDWTPSGITGTYRNQGVESYLSLAWKDQRCALSFEADKDTLALGSSDGAIDPGSATVAFRKVVPKACPTACVKDGYNAFWDASGQMMFSPAGGEPADGCEIYFGYIDFDKTTGPPPSGSGSLVFFDSQQVRYEATYTPASFVVKAPGCTYYFNGPKISTDSRDGAYKLKLQGELSGPACPAPGATDCFQGYWAGTSTAGALAFADTARSFCPAFFAVTDAASTEVAGSFTIVAVSVVYSTDWAGPGYSGSYSDGAVKISTPGCTGTYILDPASAGGKSLVLPGAPPPRPGSATMNFVGSFAMAEGGGDGVHCSTPCVSKGFSLAWDTTGQVIATPRYSGDQCPTYFGVALPGSGLPPYGSGAIYLIDAYNNQLIALYTPLFFVVIPLSSEGCAYFFDRPVFNHRTGPDGLAKLILDGEPTGSNCPSPGPAECFMGYWAVSNAATGVLGFVDTGRGPCAAFFAQAYVVPLVEAGGFDITVTATSGEITLLSEGYTGFYNTQDLGIVINIPGCTAKYKVDPATLDSQCPAPPAEKCCTRVVERPSSKLRVQFAEYEDRAISSITLWDATGGMLDASPASLVDAVISVSSADKSVTGCFLAGRSDAMPPSHGFAGRDVVCGATGEQVVLSFPSVLAGGKGKLAVKLCTVPADSDMPANATLWVKSVM